MSGEQMPSILLHAFDQKDRWNDMQLYLIVLGVAIRSLYLRISVYSSAKSPKEIRTAPHRQQFTRWLWRVHRFVTTAPAVVYECS